MFLKGIADGIIQINNILRKNRCYLFDILIHKSYEIKLQNEFQCTIYTIKPNYNTKDSNYMKDGLSKEKIINIINDIYNYQIIKESSKKNYSKIKLEKENSNLNLNNCTITYKYESPTNVNIGSESKMKKELIQKNSSENKMEEEPIQENSSENKSENKMEEESLNLNNFVPSKSSLKKVKGPNKKKSESLGSVSEEDDEFRIY